MLRHIVSWKLNGKTLEDRNRQAAEIAAALAPLEESVPSVRELHVHRNELNDGENFDLTLVADFDDADGLAEYASHPEHVDAGKIIKEYSQARVATDFTV